MEWRELLRQTNSVLLCGRNTWREGAEAVLLHDPASVLVAACLAEVPGLLAQIEQATQGGHYVVGCVSYEAAGALGLATHAAARALPLIWSASYPAEHVRAVAWAALRPVGEPPRPCETSLRLNVSQEEYVGAIARIKDRVARGDTYQVNYTCRAHFALSADPVEYFLALLRSHPVPYAAYVDTGEAQLLSLSPELFLKRRGEVLETRPMKGTRRRGRTLTEDAELAQELAASEKDRAENVMILDMARNDLGRVCSPGTVEVPAAFAVEKYRSVWQMTSTARGRLKPGVTLGEIVAATFPGASVTGAPKARTMEIIRELEPEPRGVYTGAIGLFLPGGDFTCSLPIRTLVHQGGQFALGIGAGILWDSEPQAEYEETLLKSRFAFVVHPCLRLWETLLLRESGEYAFEEEHLVRLRESARYWDLPFDTARAEQCLEEAARGADRLPLVVRLELDQEGELHLSSRPLPEPPQEPVPVVLSAERTCARDRFLFHKTNERRMCERERQAAIEAGFFEVVFRNERGNLTEGAITNLFLRIGGQWFTPPVEDGLLPGIWRRRFMLETGAQERSLPVSDLGAAEEVVIGNSVRGAIRVGAVYCGTRCLFGPDARG